MDGRRLRELDAHDPLAGKRALFELPPDLIYLNGNSLGPLPGTVLNRVTAMLSQQWGQDLITSWNRHGWIDLPLTVGNRIAPLLGAAAGQVICCDSISVNLFKLLAACLELRSDRQRILSLEDNFPTDLYVAQGLVRLLAGRACLKTVPESELEAALDTQTAVLLLTQVNFRDGSLLDIERLTRLAHDRGILVIWDLAHSAGAVPLHLDRWQVDFAVGCGYKFLNGGPGAPAFLYVNKAHLSAVSQPLQGWMGHQAPFAFAPDYQPAAGITRFLTGTPPILSMGALDAALEVFADVSMDAVREKSLRLSETFLALLSQQAGLNELRLLSPRQPARRGSQLAFAHPSAYAISRALADAGVLVDFRSPDVLRIGFAPLILRYQDIKKSVETLASIMATGSYRQARYQLRQKVT